LLSALSVPMSVLLTQGRVADLDNLMGELAHPARNLGLTDIVLVDAKGVVLADTGEKLFGRDLSSTPS